MKIFPARGIVTIGILFSFLSLILGSRFDSSPVRAAPASVTVQVSDPNDDVNEDGSHFDASGSTLWLGSGEDVDSSFLGLRFTNVPIPRGATITTAHLEVSPPASTWINVGLVISAEAASSSAPFSVASPPSRRATTSTSVTHSSNDQWSGGAWRRLAEVTPVIQEVISRSDWQSGNSLSLIIAGTGDTWGRKYVQSFEGGADSAPRLVIGFDSAGQVPGPAPTSTVSAATPAPTNTMPPGAATSTSTPPATSLPTRTPSVPGAPGAGEDWPQLQHDAQRTGRTADQVNPSSLRWAWNENQSNPVRISHKAQPVVAGGRMFVGGMNGRMYAIDVTSGNEAWSFAANGAIGNAAAVDSNRVIFGSDDGSVYAVDASSGQKVWEYQAQAGFDAAPLIVGGVVYIGSKDGHLYALNVNPSNPGNSSSILRWRFDTGAPIYQSAAFSQSAQAVIVGSENMFVYAIDTSGNQRWRTSNQLDGTSFRASWPVVSDQKGVVVVRTAPEYPFHDILNAGDQTIAQANGGSCPGTASGDAGQRQSEQQAIRSNLSSNPSRRSFHVLDLSNGSVKYTAPVLYTAGVGSIPAPPVIAPDGDAILVWRSCFSTFDDSSMVRRYADLGKMDLSNGSITPYTKNYSTRLFRLISDETSVLSLAGNQLLVAMSEAVGIHNIADNSGAFVLREHHSTFYDGTLTLFSSGPIPLYSSLSPSGHLAPMWSPAVVSRGLILWKADGSTIGAVGQ